MCLIPLLLKQLYVLPGQGLINCRTLFLKMLRLFELRIDVYIVPFINSRWEKRIFEELMLKVKTGYIVGWSCEARAGL